MMMRKTIVSCSEHENKRGERKVECCAIKYHFKGTDTDTDDYIE